MDTPDFENDIVQALETLNGGGLILYPTDTVWGIGCDATNAAAVNKIFELKQRPRQKSMVVLVADPRDLNRYASHLQPYIMDYLEKASRPTTVIYEGAVGLAENLIAEDGSVAIRVVQEIFCRHLIKRFRKPLVSTSANITAHPTPVHFASIKEEILLGVDYIVQYRQKDDTENQPSMLVRFNKQGEAEILRS